MVPRRTELEDDDDDEDEPPKLGRDPYEDRLPPLYEDRLPADGVVARGADS